MAGIGHWAIDDTQGSRHWFHYYYCRYTIASQAIIDDCISATAAGHCYFHADIRLTLMLSRHYITYIATFADAITPMPLS